MSVSKAMEAEAARLQMLLGKALADAGHSVEIKPDRHNRERWVIDGVPVPVDINEDMRRSAWSSRGLGRLRVRVDTLRVDVADSWRTVEVLARTTFPSAKARAATCGIDVPKVVAHIGKWLQEQAKATAHQQRRGEIIEQWRTELASIEGGHNLDGLDIAATDEGLVVSKLVVNGKQLLAVLKALGR